MTSAHPRFAEDDHPVNEPSPADVMAMLQAPDITAELVFPPLIIEDFDVPDFGGSSTNPQLVKVFIDHRIAKARPKLKRTGLTYEEWRPAVALHEQFENVLHRLRKMAYDPPDGPSAHGFATVLEHLFVRQKLDADPDAYEADLAELIDETEAEDIRNPPLDLACFPYVDEPDARDLRILKRLAELGVVDAMHQDGDFHPEKIGAKQAPDGHWYVKDKRPGGGHLRVIHDAAKISHKAAGYHAGHGEGGSHCGICRYFVAGGPACRIVVSPIAPDDGCKRFSPKG